MRRIAAVEDFNRAAATLDSIAAEILELSGVDVEGVYEQRLAIDYALSKLIKLYGGEPTTSHGFLERRSLLYAVDLVIDCVSWAAGENMECTAEAIKHANTVVDAAQKLWELSRVAKAA